MITMTGGPPLNVTRLPSRSTWREKRHLFRLNRDLVPVIPE
jgi:hypothetical protein